MENKVHYVKVIEDNSKINTEIILIIIAVLSLVVSIIIPFVQKKYDEFRVKRNFQYFLRKQIGLVLNILTQEKIEYFELSVKNNPVKKHLCLKEFIKALKSDFALHKNSVQPRIIFALLMNIQKLCLYAHRIRQTINHIDLKNITEKTLEHGKELSKSELNKIYALILIYENFSSISLFNDRFNDIKSINRVFEDESWTGVQLIEGLLNNQSILNEDLLFINDNEMNLIELQNIILILDQETRKYFNQ